MILVPSKNNEVEKQLSYSSKVEKALDFLKKCDISCLTPGRVEIDGDNMFAVYQNYETESPDKINFERHYKYIDVQYIFSGQEMIEVCDVNNVGETCVDYDADGDIEFFEDPDIEPTLLILSKGEFAVFFPEDCHKTRCNAKENIQQDIKKIIVKIKL